MSNCETQVRKPLMRHSDDDKVNIAEMVKCR